MKRVLIIAAHPDDDILGCGGFISKYRSRGVIFKVIFIAEGSSCRYVDPSCDDAVIAIELRNSSAILALKSLEVEDVEFNNLPCGQLDQTPVIMINRIIEKAIRDFSPDTVMTHSAHDANNDHKVVFHATIMATRPGAQNYIRRLMSYEVLSSSEWAFTESFQPNYFEELSSQDIVAKWQALKLYESEVRHYPFPRSETGLTTLAMMRGMQSGFKLAESFQIIRIFER